MRSLDELPENARKYVLKLEELSGCRISAIGVGPDRDQTMWFATSSTKTKLKAQYAKSPPEGACDGTGRGFPYYRQERDRRHITWRVGGACG